MFNVNARYPYLSGVVMLLNVFLLSLAWLKPEIGAPHPAAALVGKDQSDGRR